MSNEMRQAVWELKDEYIEKRRNGELVNIDDYCSKPNLNAEEQRELREQLEEYEAAKEGIKKYVASHINLDSIWEGISQKLATRRFSLDDVLSGSETVRQNVRNWLSRAYQWSAEYAAKIAKDAIPSPNRRELILAASSDSLPVEILDEEGNTTEMVEFALETEIELDSDGELVFSAIAPDGGYKGQRVIINIEHENRQLVLASPTIDENRRIQVFLDLSPLGEGIKINRDMIKAQIIHTKIV